MKYLLLLVIVVAVLWLMRMGRSSGNGEKGARADAPAGATPKRRVTAPQEMVACTHCGVHLPRSEAVPDPAGRLYCSESHRLLHEAQI